MKIILASSSPRRKELLGSLSDNFQIIVPDIDERLAPGEAPLDYATRIAREKADSVATMYSSATDGRCLIIASDTIVTIDGEIIGKPGSREEAVSILTRLGGRTHEVITAICLRVMDGSGGHSCVEAERTSVTFRKLDPSVIDEYLSRIQYHDKAGGYALQEYGDMIIEKVEGSVSNVIGFPLRLFYRLLDRCGIAGKFFS